MQYKGYLLDRFQEEAIKAIDLGHSVIVSAPTGAGKTLIAEYAVEKCINQNKRVIYTAPIKALSNQKYRDFVSQYGDLIGIVTGDVVINQYAPVLIMTTEIFRNNIFDDISRLDDVEYVIFDEIHYINDIQRGTVWEESIIFAPQSIKFVCLSATIPNLQQFADWMRSIRQIGIDIVEEKNRPIPLEHKIYMEGYGLGSLSDLKKIVTWELEDETPFYNNNKRKSQIQQAQKDGKDGLNIVKVKLIEHLKSHYRLPCLFFCFSRDGCETRALEYAEDGFLNQAEQEAILSYYDQLCNTYNLKSDRNAQLLRELVANGVAYHHAGMLPTLKEVVERLFTSGMIKLLFTTETFAVGINMPACSVVFDSLEKYDGIGFRYLKTREYHQMSGRAGRRGIDEKGYVYACVNPEFCDLNEVKRIVSDEVEAIESQFNLSYSSILNLYAKYGDQIYEVCELSLNNYQIIEELQRLEAELAPLEAERQALPEPTCIYPDVNATKEVGAYVELLEKIDSEKRSLFNRRAIIKMQYSGKRHKKLRQIQLSKLDSHLRRIEGKKAKSICHDCWNFGECKGRLNKIAWNRKTYDDILTKINIVQTYQRTQIRNRLKLLEKLGYLDEHGLSPKGELASRIYGYELQVTQIFFSGQLERLDPEALSILVMAIVYESKKDEWSKSLKEKSIVEMLHQANQEVEKIRALERRLGIEPPIPSLDPKLSAAIWAWSKGCRFEELRNYTNISDGDLVRAFRLASDLLRQISRAIPEHEALRGRIRTSIDRITRDVVDAEKQLRAGASAG